MNQTFKILEAHAVFAEVTEGAFKNYSGIVEHLKKMPAEYQSAFAALGKITQEYLENKTDPYSRYLLIMVQAMVRISIDEPFVQEGVSNNSLPEIISNISNRSKGQIWKNLTSISESISLEEIKQKKSQHKIEIENFTDVGDESIRNYLREFYFCIDFLISKLELDVSVSDFSDIKNRRISSEINSLCVAKFGIEKWGYEPDHPRMEIAHRVILAASEPTDLVKRNPEISWRFKRMASREFCDDIVRNCTKHDTPLNPPSEQLCISLNLADDLDGERKYLFALCSSHALYRDGSDAGLSTSSMDIKFSCLEFEDWDAMRMNLDNNVTSTVIFFQAPFRNQSMPYTVPTCVTDLKSDVYVWSSISSVRHIEMLHENWGVSHEAYCFNSSRAWGLGTIILKKDRFRFMFFEPSVKYLEETENNVFFLSEDTSIISEFDPSEIDLFASAYAYVILSMIQRDEIAQLLLSAAVSDEFYEFVKSQATGLII